MIDYNDQGQRAEWDESKNRRLKQVRGKGFWEVLMMRRLCEVAHPSRFGQTLILFEERGRVWVVPCVITKDKVFLKTLYPSRKYTTMFSRGELG
jgi:hypothetical protein